MTSRRSSSKSKPVIGALKPRIEYQPGTAVDTYGPEATALAALAGLILDPWQCDSLDMMCSFKADLQWACPDYCEMVARQNGKGAILEARVLAGLFLFGEKLIMWTAHETKTTDRAFLRFQVLIDNLIEAGYLAEGDVIVRQGNGKQGFEIPARPAIPERDGQPAVPARPKQELRFIARSKGSGRGFTGDLVIIDEAYDYTPLQAAALEPTLLAIDNPQVIYTSTPPLSGDTGQPLYDLRDRALSGDDEIGYRDWGLEGDLEDVLETIDVHDRTLWAKTNPALGKRISLRNVRRLLKKLGIVDFARESLGIWPRRAAELAGAITVEEWDAVGDPESTFVEALGITIALEVSANMRRASIGIRGVRADGLAHWELIDERPGVDWCVDRLVELKGKYDPLAIAINGAGAVHSLLAALTKAGITQPADKANPKRGDLLVLTGQDMADAFGQLLAAIKHKTARHREEPKLSSAQAAAKTRPLGDSGQAWSRKGSTDISPIVAVTEAHWAYERIAALVLVADPSAFYVEI